ncbi:hypothetical protein SS50377_26029 [Spironucleus salmonicida]|uniref:Transmembrane protein n=1 Tax=Spironucleus salmonicida TaxID=348837 RepID=A0A9P8LPA8_9EUKA|nr:hypothetical protein SS50377_26029 [Spironucleus salmonicida]
MNYLQWEGTSLMLIKFTANQTILINHIQQNIQDKNEYREIQIEFRNNLLMLITPVLFYFINNLMMYQMRKKQRYKDSTQLKKPIDNLSSLENDNLIDQECPESFSIE